ncbi:hotdog fold domain-containing protein [Streptomyces sp. NBRC 109706]|uniref:hotdog fold domain-containing protein n=1 Tax=Streptomyces sp. NBRC 109706 TaxID=1550035 RepID=UPI001F254A87|nr:hotdog fold domain-containing protein [Streptomyces sp. NBRC 109706]
MRYHRPVPLESPLRVLAHVTGTEGRKVYVTGSIATEEDLSSPRSWWRQRASSSHRTPSKPGPCFPACEALLGRLAPLQQEPFSGGCLPGRAEP